MKLNIKRYPKIITIIRCIVGKHLYMIDCLETRDIENLKSLVWKSCVFCGKVKPR
jgi:hypothetical protein